MHLRVCALERLIMCSRRLCSPRTLRLLLIATSCWLLWRADLRRTFPNNIYFQEQRGMQLSAACPNALLSLHNVLCAFAANHPNPGYCQGTASCLLSCYSPPALPLCPPATATSTYSHCILIHRKRQRALVLVHSARTLIRAPGANVRKQSNTDYY